MIGDKGVKLIKELTRDSSELLPAYNSQLVSEIIEEMNTTYGIIHETAAEQAKDQSDDDRLCCILQLRHASLLWNKRCLLAYHAERIQKLKEFRWQFGSLLPDAVLKNMSEDEVKWYRDYCGVLQNYMRRLNEGRGLDLTLHKKPPKRLYVQVRCLTDYGEFELDDGTSVVLTKGSTCEKLIHQAVLEQITQ